jgi:Domain of unknown function (DUF397)
VGEWVRAKACSSHTCIEVNRLEHGSGHMVWLRLSWGSKPAVVVSEAEWAAFVQGIKDGDFDHV